MSIGAELRLDPGDHGLDRLRVRDVARHPDRGDAVLGSESLCVRIGRGAVDVKNGDAGTVVGERCTAAAAQDAGASCDDRHPIGQVEQLAKTTHQFCSFRCHSHETSSKSSSESMSCERSGGISNSRVVG